MRLDGSLKSRMIQGKWNEATMLECYLLKYIFSNRGPLPRILIFSHISERDGAAMLRIIAQTFQKNKLVIECLILSTYKERLDGTSESGKALTYNPMLMLQPLMIRFRPINQTADCDFG